ncbi:MAG: tyrosine-type recombinase/integrase [Limisphaerales bacterium]
MSLELRSSSKWWYGRFRANGKDLVINLGVRIEGQRPRTLREPGDLVFERCRGHAQAEHDKTEKDLREKRNVEQLTQKLIEVKTGGPRESVKLADVPEAWVKTRRRRKNRRAIPDASEPGGAGPQKERQYLKEGKASLTRFVNHISDQNPDAVDLLDVTPEMARSFMDAEEERGVSPTTWNYMLKLLRGTFRHLEPDSQAYKRYLQTEQPRETETIFREPYSPEDLRAILESAKDDDFIRPIIVAGICTAMRRGDCCLLRKKDVDLRTGFIDVKTVKTGHIASIPIFPLLREELDHRMSTEGPFVFPEQAAMYLKNPDGITSRFQSVLAAAGFKDAEDAEDGEKVRGDVHAERETGLRQASIRDFHSFRVSWITLALTANIPVELVRKVTGHQSVEIVLKHYFKPGKEHFRALIQSAMPKLLMDGSKTRDEQMKEILEKMTDKGWRAGRNKLLRLLDGKNAKQS